MVALAPCVVIFSSMKGSAQLIAKTSSQTVSLVSRGFTSVSAGSGTTVRLLLPTGQTYKTLTGPGSMAVPGSTTISKASYSCTASAVSAATILKAKQAALVQGKAKLTGVSVRPTTREPFASHSLSLTPVESVSHCWVVIGVLLLALYLCTASRRRLGFRGIH